MLHFYVLVATDSLDPAPFAFGAGAFGRGRNAGVLGAGGSVSMDPPPLANTKIETDNTYTRLATDVWERNNVRRQPHNDCKPIAECVAAAAAAMNMDMLRVHDMHGATAWRVGPGHWPLSHWPLPTPQILLLF